MPNRPPWLEPAKVRGVTPALEFALAYAELGWPVLPLWEDSKAPCGELVPNGKNDATCDADVLRGWWEREPTCGVGIAMGPRAGVFAIDIDPRNGGTETFDMLCAKLGAPPDTVEAITGGGGRHLLFRWPEGVDQLVGSLGPGIDIKGNGYIVAEPSRHPETKREYAWEASSSPLDGIAVMDISSRWLGRLVRENRGANASPAGSGYPLTQTRWQEIRSALAAISPDEYEIWIEVGMALHWCGDPEAFHRWDTWSSDSHKYAAGECIRHWRSFGKPQGRPVTLDSVFKRAYDQGWQGPGKARPGSAGQAEATDSEAGPAHFEMITVAELLARPTHVNWALESIIEAGALGQLVGPPGSGKSLLAIGMMLSIATGEPWHGLTVSQGSAAYVAGEGFQGLARRVRAWQQHHQPAVTPFDPPMRLSLNAAQMHDPGSAGLVRDAISKMADETGQAPTLIELDTLARNFGGGDENSTADMSRFVDHVDTYLRHPFGAAVLLVHHTGHGDANRGRGSSALFAAADCAFVVEASGDHHLTLKCTKQKDAEQRPPLHFEIVPVLLALNSQSAVLKRVEGAPEAEEAFGNDAISGRADQAYQVLIDTYEQRRERLRQDGRHPEQARVDSPAWRQQCVECLGMKSKQRFYEARQRLLDTGRIEIRGVYCHVADSGDFTSPDPSPDPSPD